MHKVGSVSYARSLPIRYCKLAVCREDVPGGYPAFQHPSLNRMCRPYITVQIKVIHAMAVQSVGQKSVHSAEDRRAGSTHALQRW